MFEFFRTFISDKYVISSSENRVLEVLSNVPSQKFAKIPEEQVYSGRTFCPIFEPICIKLIVANYSRQCGPLLAKSANKCRSNVSRFGKLSISKTCLLTLSIQNCPKFFRLQHDPAAKISSESCIFVHFYSVTSH
jgi:hypothetical protein